MSSSNSFWDDPRNFFDSLPSHLPKPSFLTISQAKQEARIHSKDIFTTWNTLRAILDRHEGLIRRRWAKKSKEQRKKLLLSAWPNMSRTHRPDYRAMEKEKRQVGQVGTQFKDAYMFPSINLEDFIQANTLLSFLNSRGRNLPEAFANPDFEAAYMGFVSGAIDRPFLNCYTMLLHGQVTPQDYGQIIAWDDHEDAFDWMRDGQGIQPGEGLVILEIQKTVLRFLLACCYMILGDMPPASLTSKDTPIQADPGPVLTDPTAWSSLAALSKEAPYRVPASLDYHRLESIIAAKHSAAKDHLWTLREDPGYFAAVVNDYSDHRVEMMLDSKGRRHPDYNTENFWNNQLRKVVIVAYGSVFSWELLRTQVGHLKILEKKHASEISLKIKLPKEYMDALLYLKFALD